MRRPNLGRRFLRTICLAGLVAVLVWFPSADAVAGDEPAGPGTQRVRACDAIAATLLEQGRRQSPTLVRLLEALERSDLVVHVETGFLELPGLLRFVTAKPGNRFVRITVGVPDLEPRLIAALAHELQHAVEIAAAPEVTGKEAMENYYAAHGQQTLPRGYCTREAQKTTRAVLWEISTAATAPLKK